MPLFRAEAADALIIRPLDTMTLIYQRRSGITHMVAQPVPEILAVMGDQAMNAKDVAVKLSESFDLGVIEDAIEIVADRLQELADLGLIEQAAPDA